MRIDETALRRLAIRPPAAATAAAADGAAAEDDDLHAAHLRSLRHVDRL